MTDKKLLLIKIITLLYRQSQLMIKEDHIKDTINNVLDTIIVPEDKIGINRDLEIITGLKNTIINMLKDPMDQEYDKDLLLQQIKLICDDDENVYNSFLIGINKDLSESQLKKNIISIRKFLQEYFRELSVGEVLTKAANTFKYHKNKINSLDEFISSVMVQLEPLQNFSNTKDKAIISELDIDDDNSLNRVIEEVKENTEGGLVLKSGWQDLNEALDGGFRRGEYVLIDGLEHNYKTGFTSSIFKDIAVHNKPLMLDARKKPLLLKISFEDPLRNGIKFLYQSFKHEMTGEPVYTNNVSIDEMREYVKNGLKVNGYYIKMIHVNPDEWTYRNIFNLIIQLESEGYEVHALLVDYMNKLPKTGIQYTVTGGDIKEMLSRIKHFCRSKNILFLTPHQLSSESRNLLRNSLTHSNFIKEIMGKGYYDGCRTLGQDADIDMYIHKVPHEGHTYLNVGIQKHRDFVLLEENKLFYLPFPDNKMPIISDLNREKISLKKLPSKGFSLSESGF